MTWFIESDIILLYEEEVHTFCYDKVRITIILLGYFIQVLLWIDSL